MLLAKELRCAHSSNLGNTVSANRDPRGAFVEKAAVTLAENPARGRVYSPRVGTMPAGRPECLGEGNRIQPQTSDQIVSRIWILGFGGSVIRRQEIDAVRTMLLHQRRRNALNSDVSNLAFDARKWRRSARHGDNLVPLRQELRRDEDSILPRATYDEGPHQKPTISISGNGKIRRPPLSRNSRSR